MIHWHELGTIAQAMRADVIDVLVELRTYGLVTGEGLPTLQARDEGIVRPRVVANRLDPARRNTVRYVWDAAAVAARLRPDEVDDIVDRAQRIQLPERPIVDPDF